MYYGQPLNDLDMRMFLVGYIPMYRAHPIVLFQFMARDVVDHFFSEVWVARSIYSAKVLHWDIYIIFMYYIQWGYIPSYVHIEGIPIIL